VAAIGNPLEVLNCANLTIDSANRYKVDRLIEHLKECIAIQRAIGFHGDNITVDSFALEFEGRSENRRVFDCGDEQPVTASPGKTHEAKECDVIGFGRAGGK
jgi:hypothetical protein